MHVLTTQRHQIEERPVVSLLETVDVRTGARQVLNEFDGLIEAPNWKNNGTALIYNAHGRLFVYELASGRSTPLDLQYCDHCNNDHVLSPDHLRVAVSHHTYEDGLSRIYVAPIEGGPPTLVTPIGPSYLHGWSPDGQSLAYCAERNGDYNIYTIPAVGGVERQLTFTAGLNDGPEYSPCGRYLWFNSVRSGLMQLWRMEHDGADARQMTHDESNSWFPHLSPDGTTVAYITYKKGDVAPADHPANKSVEIRLMSAEGGPHRTLVQLFGGQGSLNVNSWSPDGTKLAFVSYRLTEGDQRS